MKDEVQLADILEALVHRLDKDLDQVQDAELALRRVHGKHKVQGGVVAVDQHSVTISQRPTHTMR